MHPQWRCSPHQSARVSSLCLRAKDHLEGTKVAVFPRYCAPQERPVRQRTGGHRRVATRETTGDLATRRGAGDPVRRAEWMTMSRYGHLRSVPGVVDAGYARSGNRLHSLQRSVNSTRFGASPMAYRGLRTEWSHPAPCILVCLHAPCLGASWKASCLSPTWQCVKWAKVACKRSTTSREMQSERRTFPSTAMRSHGSRDRSRRCVAALPCQESRQDRG